MGREKMQKEGRRKRIIHDVPKHGWRKNETKGIKAPDNESSQDIRDISLEQPIGSPLISRHKKLWENFKQRTSNRSKSFRNSQNNSTKTEDIDPTVFHQHESNIGLDSMKGVDKFQTIEDSDEPMVNGDSILQGDKNSKIETDIVVADKISVKQDATTFYVLDVILKEGRDLVIRDRCGTSDPYVKFKIEDKQYYKSRIVFKSLNPKWDEKFTIPVEELSKPVHVKVYDYDQGLNDDSMGGGIIETSKLQPNISKELKLLLSEQKRKLKNCPYMGYLLLQCTLIPKTIEEKEQYLRRIAKPGGGESKKLKSQLWSSIVTIVLVEGRNLVPMDDNGFSDPYVKFRLGNEKYKSKYKGKTLNPRWLEQFDLYMYVDQTSHLEVSVFDHDVGGRDDIMGRAEISLAELEVEKTHNLELPLEDGCGTIHLLLTITATLPAISPTISADVAKSKMHSKEHDDIVKKYGLLNSLRKIGDIGWLMVKVIKARDLVAADIGGKSDPFCVLELCNARLQTHTEYKTLSPEWGKTVTFDIKDIHSILEVAIYDEDKDKKAEFLGKVLIPLLRVHVGEARWYQLKDKKLLSKTKGSIQLEMDLVFNHFKAAIRTFNPKEEKYMKPEQKFKISIMKRNIARVTKIAESAVEGGKFLQSCFDWESKLRSSIAFLVFLIIVWNFELYMLPVTLLIVFFKNLLVVQLIGNFTKDKEDYDVGNEEEDDEDDEKEAKGDKKGVSFREKLQSLQEVCLQVQENMDMAASMGERVKNAFNWNVPWLSMLAVVILTIGVFVLYYVPIRYLIMLFGINKFTKKLRAPNAIPNNELLDYLSRVPSDKELAEYRELPLDPMSTVTKKKKVPTATLR